MQRAWPKLLNGLFVKWGRVAFVFLPTVLRELGICLEHKGISMRFGQNTGGSNAGKTGISFNFTPV
jgi:hypothetical protein